MRHDPVLGRDLATGGRERLLHMLRLRCGA